MVIRMAKETDIPQMIDLLLQVGQVHHKARPDLFRAGAQKYNEESLKKLLMDERRPILAAEEDGLMVGYAFCILQITENDPVLCDRRVLYIDDLCVDAAQKGKGTAQALYSAAIALAKKLNCDSLTLNVWCGNDRAMRFYEKCGLRPQKIGMETILK